MNIEYDRVQNEIEQNNLRVQELKEHKYNELLKENKKLKDRINKAIEYVEEHRIKNPYHYEYNCFMGNARASDLLEILKENKKIEDLEDGDFTDHDMLVQLVSKVRQLISEVNKLKEK